jgi:hypothetical protein
MPCQQALTTDNDDNGRAVLLVKRSIHSLYRVDYRSLLSLSF